MMVCRYTRMSKVSSTRMSLPPRRARRAGTCVALSCLYLTRRAAMPMHEAVALATARCPFAVRVRMVTPAMVIVELNTSVGDVGRLVARTVGLALGADGAAVGPADGPLGRAVGEELGRTVDCAVGWTEGNSVGCLDGATLGLSEGATVSAMVGLLVGVPGS